MTDLNQFLQRANKADDLLSKLTARVEALEKGGAVASSRTDGKILVDPKEELMTESARNKIRKMVLDLQKECKENENKTKALEKQVKSLKAENAKLAKENAKLKKGGSAPSGDVASEMARTLSSQEAYKQPLKKITESLKKWRNDVVALQNERDDLKKLVESGAKGGGMNQDMINVIREKLLAVRAEVVKYMKQKGEMVEEVVASGGGPKLEKMTMDTIKDLKYYIVTGDMKELKREWEEAELGELDDEDFQSYLNRRVRAVEIEEDDDTVNVRFDNHSTQWFPVGCLYREVESAAAPTPAQPKAGNSESSGLQQMTMDTIKERQYYFITTSLVDLKKAWYEAELGELDDEDFQIYLGRKVYAIDIEEDDDTMNVRFDNHDTQWFPVCCLYKKTEASAAPASASASSGKNKGRTQCSMDTIKERKYYYVEEDMQALKKAWYEAELGELDDDDFKTYLGRKVYAIDIEEDDDTMNVRFDNHDTQWFPVTALYSEGQASSSAKTFNAGKTQLSMDTIKERKYYFITESITELKKDWYEAELGELDDEDFQTYLGRKVYAIDVEEDDDTCNVRFDNHDTQWFPVTTMYKE